MAVCSSGISRIKAGLPHSVVIDQAYVQSILPPALAWLYPYLPWMHGLEIGDVGAFCSVDPPTWSVPNATQIYNFMTGNALSDVQLVNQFIQDVTKAFLWYKMCECASVATPAPPTAPSAPSNLPSVNPGGIVQQQPTPCASYSGKMQYSYSTPLNQKFGPLLLPVGATTVTFTSAWGPDNGSSFYPDLSFETGTTGTTWPHAVSVEWSTPAPYTHTFPITGGDTYWQLEAGTAGSVADGEFVWSADFNCGGATGTGTGGSTCSACPPDPVLMARLNEILNLVTLVQRQAVPFATVHGTAHTGLSGNGQFAVQGILGLAVDLTTTPSRLGLVAGDPDTIYDAGWVNVGTADGWGPRHFISSDPFILSPVGGDVTLVGYSIPADVVVTITEVVREP